jgi:pimeloyl-ACP methyl ester carboxylesterase
VIQKSALMLTLTGLLFPCLTHGAGHSPNPLDAAPSRYATLDGIRVHYKSLGKGETAMVFIHGWTCNLTFWREQIPAFEGKIRMILIDLPGHGESDKPMTDYTMDLFARAVDAVLKDAGVTKAVLIGHSMGTPVARQYYRLFPKKTVAIVVVDGPLRPPSLKPGDVDKAVNRFSAPSFKQNVAQFVDRTFSPRTPADVRDSVKTAMQSTPPHVAVSAMKAMYDPAIWKEDKISVPILAIMAKNQFGSAAYQSYVRGLVPQVDFQVIDRVGHFLMLEKPEIFNKRLAEFLTKQGLLKS